MPLAQGRPRASARGYAARRRNKLMKQRQFLPRPPRYRTNLLTTRLEHHGTVPYRRPSYKKWRAIFLPIFVKRSPIWFARFHRATFLSESKNRPKGFKSWFHGDFMGDFNRLSGVRIWKWCWVIASEPMTLWNSRNSAWWSWMVWCNEIFPFCAGKFRTSGESIPFRMRCSREDRWIFEIVLLIVVNYFNWRYSIQE